MNLDWLKEPDKRLHLVGGSILFSAGHIVGPFLGVDPVTAGTLNVLVLSVIKEVWDKYRPNGTGFSMLDILAAVFGAAATGVLFSLASLILAAL